MGRLIDIDVLFDYFGNDAIDKTTRSNIEYFVSEKGTVDAIPKAEIKKFLEEGIKDVNNNVLAIVREDYIHKADYENRLKADLKAILVELQLEIEESENCGKAFHLGLQIASNIIQQKINELPPVAPQEPRWIPVSERLPEERVYEDGHTEPSERVLVQLTNGEMHVSRYWTQWVCDSPWIDILYLYINKVVAWMPLPKQYDPQESEG